VPLNALCERIYWPPQLSQILFPPTAARSGIQENVGQTLVSGSKLICDCTVAGDTEAA